MTNCPTIPNAGFRLLNDAFEQLLDQPEIGSMAFCRRLQPAVTHALGANPIFRPRGWGFCVVGRDHDDANRRITSDEAVELRENKGPATLLLVDSDHAGAGMDGIYSATREIDEESLFDCVRKLAGSKFLSNIMARHRTGAAGIAREDQWLLESQTYPATCSSRVFDGHVATNRVPRHRPT
ncbi:MAG: hypothetical protein HY000_10865 [Planctomycetes bacterium]|nr:hypothetical protein [Planctomycetota bacterium]